jgi:glycosyltransferase involved in cell wall biosynthesis
MGKFKYTLPPNISEVREVFLQGDDILPKKTKPPRLSETERQALRSLMFGENEQWEPIFDLFHKKIVSLNALLMGRDFYDIIVELYNARYERVVFTDFLWTCRSMYLPIFTVLKNTFIKADMYHSVSTGYAGIVASCAGYLYQKPVILTEHGIYTREREEEIIRASWTRGIYKDLWINHFYMLSRRIYRQADRVFALFARAQELQLELGCPKSKADIISNGIKYERFQGLSGKAPDDSCINIGAIVRVTPIKDIKTMINAFHYAKEDVPELRLYIIGNTDENPVYFDECKSLIEVLGTDGIIFTGHVDLREYIGKMDIILLTSISEGQPLSILEAMAAGKPCVATQVGDCFDMLNASDPDECAGIVVPVMNIGKISGALTTLAKDEGLRLRMGENGRGIVDRYFRESLFIDRYRAVYKELMNG